MFKIKFGERCSNEYFGKMLDPIHLENDQVIVHAVRAQELERYETLIKEIFQILSDGETLEFLPEKRLYSVTDAENWLKGNILNFFCGRNFLHFITDKRSGRILGMIDIFSPSTIIEHYNFRQPPYFIEFYLRSSAKRRRIMTNLLPALMNELESRGVVKVGAVINNKNLPAQKVLLNAGFAFKCRFDITQGFYEYAPELNIGNLRNVG